MSAKETRKPLRFVTDACGYPSCYPIHWRFAEAALEVLEC